MLWSTASHAQPSEDTTCKLQEQTGLALTLHGGCLRWMSSTLDGAASVAWDTAGTPTALVRIALGTWLQ